MSVKQEITLHVEIDGHKLVTMREKTEDGEVYEFKMLRVEMQGQGDEKKNSVKILIDPLRKDEFPLGDQVEATFIIRQQRLELEK